MSFVMSSIALILDQHRLNAAIRGWYRRSGTAMTALDLIKVNEKKVLFSFNVLSNYFLNQKIKNVASLK